jgi:methionyl-tRNA formyltransferase
MNRRHSFAYFGTPKVSSDTLAKLIEHNFIPAVVITSPDAPRGRGLALEPSEVKTFALAHNISIITPEKLDVETIAAIRAKKCDYAVVVAYGKIFPKELIGIFPNDVLNVHYSLLPKYRGATPLESAILEGDSITGVTVQKMVREVDAGDILAQKETPITPTETALDVRPRLIALGAQLLVDTIPKYLNGGIIPIQQDASLASHTEKIKKEDGLLSLDAPAEENWNKYRAYADGIGTYFFENGKRIKIIRASFKNGKFIIERIIPEGKREMNYR